MSLTWTAPAVLWLLAAVPLVWAASRFSRTNFNPRQRVVQTLVRSALLALLMLSLARPVISTGSSQLSVVYLVDVSHSIGSKSIADAASKIDELNAAVKPRHFKVVAFAADSVVLDSTDALRRIGALDPASDQSPVNRAGTDLESALGDARAALAPGRIGRIVLFSDGRPTTGAAQDAVLRLAAEGIPVHVQPLGVRGLGDTWVQSIDVPDRLSAGAPFTATVRVGSQRAGAAQVELRSSNRVLATATVALAPGETAVPLEATLDWVGSQIIDAVVKMPADPLPANDQMAREAWVGPRPKVLYLEGATASAGYLSGALAASGFDVSVQRPDALPARLDDYDPWDVVILSDVPRKAMSDDAMNALADWVEKEGGGLLVAGGESVFGEGGYRKTTLERITPVTFERKDEPEIALIIILDRSWSMAGQVIELCKSAAQAAIDALADEQSVGLITFNDGFDWDVTLRNVGKNREAIRQAVAKIEAGGHTLIYPAIEQAFGALKDAKARAKHVVLLTDGRSYPDDYEGLVKKMVASRITVSTIAVGPAADGELLANIATWGRGRTYVVEDAKEVPQIFVKEAKDVPTLSFDEKAIVPVVKHRAFLEGIDLARAPALRGRTATVLKDNALALLETADNDPLLAFWPIGLGRAAVFTSDVKDRWASAWLKWPGYGPFFASTVRALERQRPRAVALELTPGPIRSGARTIGIAIEARDPLGRPRDLLRPVVRVRAGENLPVDLAARQVAPGRYETHVVVDARQPMTVEVAGNDAGVTTRAVLPDPAREYRFSPPDAVLLQSIATATGGSWAPAPQAIANTAGASRLSRRPLWPSLMLTALALWFVDLLLRRIRVFEPAANPESSSRPHRS